MDVLYVRASSLMPVQFYEVDLPPVSEKKIKLVNAVIPDEKKVSTCAQATWNTDCHSVKLSHPLCLGIKLKPKMPWSVTGGELNL